MQEAKNTARALVRIGYDGRVHKHFKGPQARERFANEQRVLEFLAQKGCAFVPRLISSNPTELYLITSNAGQRVEHISKVKCQQMFAKLEQFGVHMGMQKYVILRIINNRGNLISSTLNFLLS